MGPRILVFQHHPQSPAGLVGERMAARAAKATTLDAQAGIDLPADAADHDGLLILGGAMNAYDDRLCRHFPALLDLARSFAASGKPVLGICLGGQLLARAWGASVHLGAASEFGVVELTPTSEAGCDPLLQGSPKMVPAMQWHEDSFDLPEGAVPLLTGAACRYQAFRVDGVVWGFQCHFEADRRDMVNWAIYRRDTYGYEDFAARLAEQAATHGGPRRRSGGRWPTGG
jgi:GMP synthase (glutamine-hydrolysing)